LMLYADLLYLGAKLLLIEALPSPELCHFLGASEDCSQRQIAKVISEDGIFLNGRHFELPPVCSLHSTRQAVGVPMPDGWMPGTANVCSDVEQQRSATSPKFGRTPNT